VRKKNHNMKPFFACIMYNKENPNKKKRMAEPILFFSRRKRQKAINNNMIMVSSHKCNSNHECTEEELNKLICPKCHAKGLEHYSSYKRWALTLETDGVGQLTLKEIRVEVERAKCGCNKTHALLPGDIIPYKQYSLDAVIAILKFVLSGNISVESVAKMLGIPPQVIYGIIRLWSAMLYKVALLMRAVFHLYTFTGSDCEKAAILQYIAEHMDMAPQGYLKYYKWPMFMTWSQNAIPQKSYIGILE